MILRAIILITWEEKCTTPNRKPNKVSVVRRQLMCHYKYQILVDVIKLSAELL